MEVLKIRNQVTGEWEEITAIKGADGKTPIKGVDYYTEAEKQELINEINQSSVDLSDYYTKEETDALIPDTSLYVTGEYVQTAINESQQDLTPYATKQYVDEAIADIHIPEGEASVEEVYVGDTAPTDENIKIWVDTSEITEEIATEDYVDTEITTLKNYVDEQIAAAIPATVEGVEF